MSNNWKTIKSSYVIEDRWIRLRADSCQMPDGKVIEPWYVLEYPEWVNCLVIDANDEVILLKHYRHGADTEVTEIIGGIADSDDASTIDTIKRELSEEIGLDNPTVYKTGVTYANPSTQNNKVHMYLALGGTHTGEQQKETGADFSLLRMPFEDFYQMVTKPEQHEIFQALHMASIFYSLNFMSNIETGDQQILRLRSKMRHIHP